MPEDKKYKKLNKEARKEIRYRTDLESGRKGRKATQSTGVGTALRKTFTKSKHGRKPVGKGDVGFKYNKPIKPEKPKLESVQVQSKNSGPKGEISRSKTYRVKSKDEESDKRKQSQKEAGFSTEVKSKSKVGEPIYKKNLTKKKAHKKEEKDAHYVPRTRTNQTIAKKKALSKARGRFIEQSGGKEVKGERRFKKHLKKKYKREVREGTYSRD